MIDDDDGDGDLSLQLSNACGCKDRKHLSCYGCGACYHLSLVSSGNKLGHDFEGHEDLMQPDYGTVRWFCPQCDVAMKKGFVKTLITTPVAGSDDILTNLRMETDEIKATLNEVVSCLRELAPSGFDTKSPKRKLARSASVVFGEDNNVSAINFGKILPNGINKKVLVPPMDISGSHIPVFPADTYSDKVKLNIKSSENILKKLHENKNFIPGMFIKNKKADGSCDALFKTFSDAKKAKDLLDEKLDNAVIGSPTLDGLKKFNLVGLTFEMEKCDIMQSIVDENSSWLDLVRISDDTVGIRNDPFAVLTVCDVFKCRNNEVFRVLVTMSKRMLAFIGKRKLSIGFSKCCLYDIPNQNRCFKCQRGGHFAKECPNPVACSRCSLEHSARVCQSACFKCVKCSLDGRDDVCHPSYSNLCPFNK